MSHVFRILRVSGVIGAAFLLCGASDPRPQAAAEPPGSASAYRLAPGDRIAIVVFGETEFSGDFLVEASGAITLPFAGEITAGGRTLAECRAAVTARLADGLLKNPAVSVRIQEFRPIYVMGDVRSPGAYAFRYGATVVSAVATAGGYRVPTVSRASADAEYLSAEEHYRDLRVQRLALLARQSRLAAQTSGAKDIEAPRAPDAADMADLVADAADMADLIASEREAFVAARDALSSQLALMRSQKPRIEAEIAAIKAQKAVEEEQAGAIHEQSQHYTGLVKQGLGLATQDLQFKLEETTRREDIMRLTADISRLEMDSGDIDIRIADAEATFKRQTGTELEDVRQRLKQTQVALGLAQRIVGVKKLQADAVAAVESAGKRRLVVSREQDGQTVTISAQDSTPLSPGDVVEVERDGSPDLAEEAPNEPNQEAQAVGVR